jgi:hypothetical protein
MDLIHMLAGATASHAIRHFQLIWVKVYYTLCTNGSSSSTNTNIGLHARILDRDSVQDLGQIPKGLQAFLVHHTGTAAASSSLMAGDQTA